MMTGDILARSQEFCLSRKAAKGLFVFYVTLIASGIVAVVAALNVTHQSVSVLRCCVVGVGGGAIGGGAYYARRLYRAGVDRQLRFESHPSEFAFAVGVYLFVRPLLSVALGVLSVVALLAALASGAGNGRIAISFLYTSCIASFTSGFASGRLLDRLRDAIDPELDGALKGRGL